LKALYIFATSERPDVYINALTHAIEHHGVSSIHVVVISEHDYVDEEDRQSSLLASTVVSRVSEQLEALQRREYIDFRSRDVTPLPTTASVQVYGRCLNAMNRSGTTSLVVPIQQLDKRLRSFVASGSCVFDVSALKKNLLVDVLATLLSLSFSEVYSFELKRQTFGPSDLYHALTPNEDFTWRNLTTSSSVRRALKRISRWNLRSRLALIFVAAIAGIFALLRVFYPEGESLSIFNAAAMVASIGSFFFILVMDRYGD